MGSVLNKLQELNLDVGTKHIFPFNNRWQVIMEKREHLPHLDITVVQGKLKEGSEQGHLIVNKGCWSVCIGCEISPVIILINVIMHACLYRHLFPACDPR